MFELPGLLQRNRHGIRTQLLVDPSRPEETRGLVRCRRREGSGSGRLPTRLDFYNLRKRISK